MRYMVITSRISVIGRIWMPGITAAMDYTPEAYDVENMRDDDGNITRESVQGWLDTHAGDFAEITDFSANIADGDSDVILEWSDEESELTYSDCMFPAED